MKFTEAKLEQVFIDLLHEEGCQYVSGDKIDRSEEDVLIKEDIRSFLKKQYSKDGITDSEIDGIIRDLEKLPASDLYETNKTVMRKVSDGFHLKREDHKLKDLYIRLIDFEGLTKEYTASQTAELSVAADGKEKYQTHADQNIYKFVNQFEIQGYEKRIPDGILFINGLSLVVFELKSAIRENTNIHDAYIQLTTRYKRDIPELFKYNAFAL